MKRYVFYDTETGKILHTHHVVTADGDEQDVGAADLEEVARMVNLSATSWLLTDFPTRSSRGAVHRVDVEQQRVLTSRVRRPESRSARRTTGS